MNKYAVIEIKSAKFPIELMMVNGKICSSRIISKDSDVDDYVRDRQTRELNRRVLGECVGIPEKETDLITKHQVSAMLHVLLGSRPVSYVHGSNYSPSEVINGLAEKALVKANSSFCYKTKGGENAVSFELTQSCKSKWDSNKKGVVTVDEEGNVHNGKCTWDSLKRRYLLQEIDGISKYDYIMNFFHNICDDNSLFEKHNLIDFLKTICSDNNKKEKVCEFFVNLGGCTPFLNLIEGNDSSGIDGKNVGNNLAAQTNTKGIKAKMTLDATVLVPVSNEVAKDFVNGTHFASFGDSGLAVFKGIETFDEDELVDYEDFIYINN